MGPRLVYSILLLGLAMPTLRHAPAAVADQPSGRVQSILRRYDEGDRDRVGAEFGQASLEDFSAVTKVFQKSAAAWIADAPEASASRRRIVVASVTLELSYASLYIVHRADPVHERYDTALRYRQVRPLLEWACSLVRSNPPGAAEHLWQLGAIAVVDGARDYNFLITVSRNDPRARTWSYVNHLEHAVSQFPDEPRFQLAAAVALESYPIMGEGLIQNSVRQAEQVAVRRRELIGRFEALTRIPEIAGEAQLHPAYQALLLGDASAALTGFDAAAASAGSDPYVEYLGRFFAGRLCERLGRPADAEARYEAALAVLPSTQSGVEALATRLFLRGERARAASLVDASLADSPQGDPWLQFPLGDFRRWPGLVKRLHNALD